jgi:pyruvate/2-oxoglutarate/acetoin dehydrogenase E1 component
MNHVGADPRSVFIGYNVGCGGLANGTLIDVPPAQRIETPVAENLMVSMAIGMSLAGHKPIVYIERFDFILNAMDALVNHLDKIKLLSDGHFNPHILLRVVVGGTQAPLFTGPTHTQNFTQALRSFVQFDILELKHTSQVKEFYHRAWERLDITSTMLVEYRDKYNTTL